jgi:hypothetical protein
MTMKRHLLGLASLLLLPAAFAGEAGLVRTYQPLYAFEGDGPLIEPVTCYVHSISGGSTNAMTLISAENHPPTRSEHKPGDVNLTSIYGIEFTQVNGGSPDPTVTLDATHIKKAEGTSGSHDREVVVRASLECLRRTRPEKIAKLPIKLACRDEDRAWLEPIVKEFNKHDPAKVFFKDPS